MTTPQPGEGHSPLPWRVEQKFSTRIVCGVDDTVTTTSCQSDKHEEWRPNAAYIVTACNAFPLLVGALELGLQMQKDGDVWSVDPEKMRAFKAKAEEVLKSIRNGGGL